MRNAVHALESAASRRPSRLLFQPHIRQSDLRNLDDVSSLITDCSMSRAAARGGSAAHFQSFPEPVENS